MPQSMPRSMPRGCKPRPAAPASFRSFKQCFNCARTFAFPQFGFGLVEVAYNFGAGTITPLLSRGILASRYSSIPLFPGITIGGKALSFLGMFTIPARTPRVVLLCDPIVFPPLMLILPSHGFY